MESVRDQSLTRENEKGSSMDISYAPNQVENRKKLDAGAVGVPAFKRKLANISIFSDIAIASTMLEALCLRRKKSPAKF